MTLHPAHEKGSPSPPPWQAWAVFSLAFYLFPILLLGYGLSHLFRIQAATDRTRLLEQMNGGLDGLTTIQSEDRFLHTMFRDFVDEGCRRPNTPAFAKWLEKSLRQRFGRDLRILAFGAEGTLLARSPGLEGNGAEWRRIWHALRHVQAYRKNFDRPAVARVLPDLRRFMGRFIYLQSLGNPGKGDPHLIFSQVEPQPTFFWYGLEEKFGLMVSLSSEMLQKKTGLQRAIRKANKNRGAGYFFGWQSPLGEPPNFGGHSCQRQEILEALPLLRQGYEEVVETPSYLIQRRLYERGLLLAIGPRTDSTLDPARRTRQWVLLIAGLLLPIPMGGILFLTGRIRLRFNIRWQLAWVFLFANGLPLCIMAFLAREFLEARIRAAEYEVQTASVAAMENTDQLFPGFLKKREERIHRLLARLPGFLTRHTGQEALEEFWQPVFQSGCASFLLVASDGRLLKTNLDFSLTAKIGAPVKTTGPEQNFLSIVGGKILDEVNGARPQTRGVNRFDLLAETLGRQNRDQFLVSLMEGLDTLNMLGTSFSNNFIYIGLIRGTRTGPVDYLLAGTWRRKMVWRQFLESFLQNRQRTGSRVLWVAAESDSDQTYPLTFRHQEGLQEFRRTLRQRSTVTSARLRIGGREYWATGFPAQRIPNIILIRMVPYRAIAGPVQALRSKLILFGWLSLLVSALVAGGLSRSFLVPIEKLTVGALALQDRNFEHRLASRGDDEFGRLGEALNRAAEGLGELHLAGAVQRSLHPPASMAAGRFGIHCGSIPCQDLGGDFIDLRPWEDERPDAQTGLLALAMGDVRQSGIPAALRLGLAKSALFFGLRTSPTPAAWLEQLHAFFIRLPADRETLSEPPRLLACLTMQLDPETGRIRIANADAPPPLLFRNAPRSAQRLGKAGSPIGSSLAPQVEETEETLGAGDYLLIHSDGLLRRLGKSPALDEGELVEIYDPDPERFSSRLDDLVGERLAGNAPPDDISFLIVGTRS